jgi:uncharacterized protein (TIGR02594 family)
MPRRPGQINVGNAGLSGPASQQEIGSSLDAFSEKMLEQSRTADQTAQYTKAITEATVEFNSRVMERINTKVDEEGNPTFNNLTNDIGTIGIDVGQRVMEGIQDPEARRKFAEQFDTSIQNARIKSIGEARSQQLDFARTTIFQNLDQLSESSLTGSSDEVEFNTGQVDLILFDALRAGVISDAERMQYREQYVKKVNVGRFRTFIAKDPESALNQLTEDQSIDLDEDSKQKLINEANSALDKQIKEQEKIAGEAKKQLEQKQYLLSLQLDAKLAAGALNIDEIESSRDDLGEELYYKTLSKFFRAEKKATKEDELYEKMSQDISSGQSLYSYSDGDIGKHFSKTKDLLSKVSEQPLTLIDSAKLATSYNRPVAPYQAELKNTILYGSTEQGIEALQAYSISAQHAPASVQGLDSKAKSILGLANTLIQSSNLSQEQALVKAKQSVLEVDDKVRLEREREWSEIVRKDELGKNIAAEQEFFAELFEQEGFNFFDREIEPGLTVTMTDLLKEEYLRTGSIDHASKSLTQTMSQTIGETEFNGGKFVMRLPPEKMFPNFTFDELHDSFVSDMRQASPSLLPENLEIRTLEDSRRISKDGRQTIAYGVIDKETGLPVQNSVGENLVWVVDDKAILESKQKALEEKNARFEDIIDSNVKKAEIEHQKRVIETNTPKEQRNEYRKAEMERLGIPKSTPPIDAVAPFMGMHERKDTEKLKAFLGVDPSKTPWCAAFVGAVIESQGGKGTGSNLARSYLEWGRPVTQGRRGDVLVFQRGNSAWQGHVGFFVREEQRNGKDGFIVLGGNQGNQVKESWYPKSRLLGIRRQE